MLASVSLLCPEQQAQLSLVPVAVTCHSAGDASSKSSLCQLGRTLWKLRSHSTPSVTSGPQPPANTQRNAQRTRVCARLQPNSAKSSVLSSGERVLQANFILKFGPFPLRKLQARSLCWYDSSRATCLLLA